MSENRLRVESQSQLTRLLEAGGLHIHLIGGRLWHEWYCGASVEPRP